ncbi:PREDICTED: probable FBD-associated F-box protein At1g32375 [Camelina sativa]|uniref:Probable FBD-associated F-box protein At1g32375 n=1 Tax=Camelina sativa TaxID=90675 RepID=A0ABM0UTL4_CAMSA|nr:PREDICTED: probable FBD-associated F-box protein At1g32375 [Camelina sativa]
MDRISGLPDAVLVGILSQQPTRDVVATMVLSKRWRFLWRMVPKLVYDDSYQSNEFGKFSIFVLRSLVLHEAPVIKTLRFKLDQKSCNAIDIGVWFRVIARHVVRKLVIEIVTSSSQTTPAVTLPRSLYTCCKMLVILKLSNTVLLDDAFASIFFPSLKKLSLESMKYPPGGDEFFKKLLLSCPVLEDLYVEQCPDDNVTVFTVRVPSLKYASLYKSQDRVKDDKDGFVINTPLLEHLVISEYSSFQRLYLCLPTAKDAYPIGSVFRSLYHNEDYPRPCWSEPSSIPKCLVTSLETLKWVNYEGYKEEKQVAAFILRNANRLKKAIFSSDDSNDHEKSEMLKELLSSSSPMCSRTCQLRFD